MEYNSIKEDEQIYQQNLQFIDIISTELEEDEFEIGFKPKKKKFYSSLEKKTFIEEYTKKKKTELCKNFMLKGKCKFGAECSYAHGYVELLPKTHLHSNYKTKPCNNFLKNGWCNYGARCQYIHCHTLLNKKNQDKIILTNKKTNNSQKTHKVEKSIYCEKKSSKKISDIVLYSEHLQQLNSIPQFNVSNFPRLNYLKRLCQSNICFLSDDSDP